MSGADCDLCGRSVAARAVADGRDGAYCSEGCRDVAAAYGSPTDGTADAVPEGGVSTGGATPDADGEATSRTFFRLDGVSRPIDEDYLEAVATGLDGVESAAASYVTETIRVDHHPDRVDAAEVQSALTTLGYSAHPRRVESGDDGADAASERSPESLADRRRSVEDLLSARYVVGVVFGSFMLLPYVVFLYPAYLAPYVGGELAALYGDALDGSTALMLPLFAVIAGIVVAFTGMRVLRGGYVSLAMRRATTDLLVAVAVLAAYGYGVLAMLVGHGHLYFDLTVVAAASVTAVALYETTVKRRALDRLTDLTVSRTATARLADAADDEEVAVEDLTAGEDVLVREGERIPVDGTVAEGECTVDEAVVTGESLPVVKRAGDPVVGGSLVTGGAAVVEVGAGGSTVERIRTALWSIQSADHGIQRGADRIASLALPVVAVVGVGALAVGLLTGGDPVTALLGGLLAVVVTAPWTLGVATPLSVATSVRDAVERGVIVLDDTVFERLRDVDVVVLDKTGTLTTGEMRVREADGPEDLLSAAAALERRGVHPAAEAIVRAFGNGSATDPDEANDEGRRVREFESHATGVSGTVDGEKVLVGHPDLFAEFGWSVAESLADRVESAREAGHLPVLVGRGEAAEGVVVLGDDPREEWTSAVAELDDRGLSVVVLTGDDSRAAEAFADHPCVDHVFAGVPPAGKTEAVRRIGAGRTVAMVGDGTNDAPALAAADLGIAMETGTAIAADAADVVLVDDDLSLVTAAFDLARAAGRRVNRNVALSLGYNAVALPLFLAGYANPLFVILGATLSLSLLVANSFRGL